MNAILVGWDSPLITVFTDKFGSSIDGPDEEFATAVCTVDELLLMSGSSSIAVTLAVFDNVPGACGVTVMLIIALPPFPTDPRLQVTVAVPLQVPCDGIAETKLTPPGRVSVTVTLVAGEWPLLATTSR
jgi:hypothetical protein